NILGIRFTPVYLGAAVENVEHIITDAAPAAVVYDPVRCADRDLDITAITARAGVRTVFTVGSPVGTEIDLAAEVATRSAEPMAIEARDADIARIMYTGGTTGKPKGVAYSFAALDAAAAAGGALPPGLRFLVGTPIAHAAGSIALGVLRAGGSVHLFDDFDADAILDEIGTASAEGAAVASYLYPPYLYRLLDHPRFTSTDKTSIKFLVYGSAPMSPSRLHSAITELGPILRQGYAQTEAIGIAGLSFADHAQAVNGRPELLSSVGRPIPVVKVRITDPSGTEVATGDTGEVCVEGPTVMSGYWNNPALTSEVLRDGWLHTGDAGYVDDEGYLYLVGRLRELVIVDGHNCYTQPIENALSADPAVAEVAVFGVPDEVTGEALVAVVRAAGEVDENALRERVRTALGSTNVPSRIVVVDEMPTASFGKPDKKALKARFLG
ncbi:MAG: AMP-binding protein, partial [Actinomycetota bacterium]|nr:AMP-binding protein [Actinomycetota bacterium]